jgi:hypothetical protein
MPKVFLENVIFCHADAEAVPIKTRSIDVALVNGIFNLNPSRTAIFRELARVLRSGGAAYAAELILREPLPPDVRSNETNWRMNRRRQGRPCLPGGIPRRRIQSGEDAPDQPQRSDKESARTRGGNASSNIVSGRAARQEADVLADRLLGVGGREAEPAETALCRAEERSAQHMGEPA